MYSKGVSFDAFGSAVLRTPGFKGVSVAPGRYAGVLPPALEAIVLLRVELGSLTGVFSSLLTPRKPCLVFEPALAPGAESPSLEDEPARFKDGLSPPAFDCKPSLEDDPALDKPPGGLSPVAPSFLKVEFRPVLDVMPPVF